MWKVRARLSRTRTRIGSFFEEHPNLSYLAIALVLVVSLFTIHSLAASFYPPKMIGDYLVYIEYKGNLYSATHRYMLPIVYSSLIFLVLSLPYLNRKLVRTFEEIKELISEPEEISSKSIKLASSRYRYLVAAIVGFLLLFGPFILIWMTLEPFEIVYIVLPTATITLITYFLVAFLSALGLWLIVASTYFINQVAGQQFRIDIEDPSSWIDDDKIGGFKQLSDFSLRLFGFLTLGVLFFSPAALLYYALWYVAYVFTLVPIGLLFLIVAQHILHKSIRRHKKCFYDLAKRKRHAREITVSRYIETLLAIKAIKDRPVDLKVLWGILISSIVFPTLFWYISTILREILGIVMP